MLEARGFKEKVHARSLRLRRKMKLLCNLQIHECVKKWLSSNTLEAERVTSVVKDHIRMQTNNLLHVFDDYND